MIYLDNAATTRVDERVFESMSPYFMDLYGNPGGLYALGRASHEAIEESRKRVSRFMKVSPNRIVFTSGGSEGNNSVFQGVRRYLKSTGRTKVVVSSIEHESVLKAANSLKEDGFQIVFAKPNKGGIVTRDKIKRIFQEEKADSIGLVSVMAVNNEVGTQNPIREIYSLCKENGVLLHADCVQAAGEVDLGEVKADFMTVSSHKIHGPKGVGALYVRNKKVFSPLILGGNTQEFGLRGGTENVPGVVGFGVACEIAERQRNSAVAKMARLKRVFIKTMELEFGAGLKEVGISVNGDASQTISKILNLTVDGVHGETLVLLLNNYGVYISAGSACQSKESNPSHVLTGIGLTEEEARSSVRVSFSRYSTTEEVKEAARAMVNAINSLRKSCCWQDFVNRSAE